ncbi:MAG: hypothetical protein FWC71_02200 [Defluviitaleaceae bacterium]|nr:hypothetical protein [Defluviitaleaceae bacterium]
MSLYQEQKKIKPKIEDVIPVCLDGDMQDIALDFVATLRSNKINPSWTLTNQWKSVCKGKNIFRLSLLPWTPPGKSQNAKWVVTAYLQHLDKYTDIVIAENLQSFLFDNVNYCVQKPSNSPPEAAFRQHSFAPPCNTWNCAPGKDIIICNQKLTNICANGNREYFWFHDPDKNTLNAIIRLLNLERTARLENK